MDVLDDLGMFPEPRDPTPKELAKLDIMETSRRCDGCRRVRHDVVNRTVKGGIVFRFCPDCAAKYAVPIEQEPAAVDPPAAVGSGEEGT